MVPMTRFWLWLAALVLFLVLAGAYLISVTPFQVDQEAAVRRTVEEFGQQLKDVSLLAPAEDLAIALQANYSPYVVESLINVWLSDPMRAPGRLTSSPWPERIDIRTITKESDTRFRVEGDIVEVTNEGGGIGEPPTEALRRPISITVELMSGDWKIIQFSMAPAPNEGQWLRSQPNAQEITFMYPIELPTTYIQAAQWPPVVEKVANQYSCNPRPITAADGPLQTVEKRTIGDREYCVTSRAQGTAEGDVRANEYAFAFGDTTYRLFFQLRYPQCLNLEGPQQQACISEQENYNLDAVIDRIAQSIRVGK